MLYPAALQPDHGYRWRYRGSTPSPEQFRNDLFDGTLAQFIVERIADSELLGIVAAYRPQLEQGTVYFSFTRVDPTMEPLGEMFSGLFLFVDYLFRTWNLRKVYAEIPGFNWQQFASGESTLFDVEGVLTDHDFYDGRFWPLRIIAISKGRWEQIRERWEEILRSS